MNQDFITNIGDWGVGDIRDSLSTTPTVEIPDDALTAALDTELTNVQVYEAWADLLQGKTSEEQITSLENLKKVAPEYKAQIDRVISGVREFDIQKEQEERPV